MRDKNVQGAQMKLEEFAQYDTLDCGKFLIILIKTKKTPSPLRMAAVGVLSELTNVDVRKKIVTETRSKTYGSYYLQSLSKIKDEHLLKACSEIILKSREQGLLVAAIRLMAFQDKHPETVVKKMISLVANKRSPLPIRKAVVEAMGSIKDRRMARALMKLMLQDGISVISGHSLERLTGQNFGRNEEEWNKWFTENKDFEPVNTH